MQQFEFSDKEREVICDVLKHAISELGHEVFHTDTHDFKEMLRQRKALLEAVLRRLSLQPVEV